MERYAYDAYGKLTVTDGSGTVLGGSAYGNRYTYTGREWDGELGLYHYRARMYSPDSGRFISRDPIGYRAGSFNLFGYCGAMPGIFVDPLGLTRKDPAGNSCDDCEKFGNRIEIRIKAPKKPIKPLYQECKAKHREAGEPLGANPSFEALAAWCEHEGHFNPKDYKDGVGHTWIKIDGLCGNVGYGYWPSGGFLGGDPGVVIDEKDNDNGGYEYYTHYKRYYVCNNTCDCIKNEVKRIAANPGTYDPLDPSCTNGSRHCTTFAVESLKNCGIDFPKYLSGAPLGPEDIVEWPGVWPKHADSDNDPWGDPFES